MNSCASASGCQKIPQRIVDPHHHFYAVLEEGPGGHSGFLRLGAPTHPRGLRQGQGDLNIVQRHVEALPDDGGGGRVGRVAMGERPCQGPRR